MTRGRLAVAYSVRDPAGSGAARILVELAGGERAECPGAVECYALSGGVMLGGFEVDTPFMDMLSETPDPAAEAVIVLSRHSGSSGVKTLSVHHTGNPTDRTLGGRPRELALAYPQLSKALMLAYREEAEEAGILGEYDLKLEATHHGPTTVDKPVVFIEIGSGPEEWRDPRAQRAMAAAVLRVLESGPAEGCTPATGYGGGHYPVRFTKLHLESDYCFGHILAKYVLREGLDPNVIRQSVEKNYPTRPVKAVVEKKSLRSAERREFEGILRSLGVEVEFI
ncbi:D-aminoacyl-tRNA deacylase [Stetteria hydrogenophila]